MFRRRTMRNCTYCCDLCDKLLPTYQSLSLHKFTCHRVESRFRHRVESSSCPTCLFDYHTRERCIRHAQNTRCGLTLERFCAPLPAETAAALDRAWAQTAREFQREGRRRMLYLDRVFCQLKPYMLEESHDSYDSIGCERTKGTS